MKFLKILFLAFGLFFSMNAYSQTGQTGAGSFDYEYQWLCDDSTDLSFYRVTLHRPGFAAIVIGNYEPDGSAYTPSTQILVGPCATSGGSFPDSSYQYSYVELCDKSLGVGISYIAIFVHATNNANGNKTKYKLGNYLPDTGGSFTPGGGAQLGGFCIGLSINTGSAVNVIQSTGGSGSLLYADNAMSIDILNVGAEIALLTINSDSYELLPGERWFCHKQWDEVTRTTYRCPAVTYNANYNSKSTTLHMTQKAY